jgi:hypothetical protein
MAGIFINYRHDDTPGVAGRLFDYLALRYSHSELFMDVDAMQPGIDFAKQLEVQVSQCHAVIAAIGPRWLDARDQAGHRRLDSASDYVRIELALALQRNIPVIPVLVDGAVMPAEDELPDDLKPLARRHALELRHTRFPSDADTIMRALEKIVPRSHVPWRYVGSGAALVVIIVLAMLWPIFNAKLHPPAQIAANPPVVTTPPTVAPPTPNSATVPAAPTLRSTAPGTAIPAPPPSVPNSAPAGTQPAPASSSRPMINTNLMGSDYGTAVLSTDDWTECRSRCRADNQCVAWTAVHPGVQGPNARCWLKNAIPEPSANSCCVSGIERTEVH